MPKVQAPTAARPSKNRVKTPQKQARNLRIGDQSIEVIKPAADNAREIAEGALEGLGSSMHDFGDLSGIVWNERTGELVCGHQRMDRLRAAGAKGWTRLSQHHGIILHPVTGEKFYIRIVDWDRAKQVAANLTANNPSIAGDFTAAALEQLRALEHDASFDAVRLAELERQLAERFEGGEPDLP